MGQLLRQLEDSLMAASSQSGDQLHARYLVLKQELLEKQYSFWAASFPGGNDHGPEHIKRVLEYLGALVGPEPVSPDRLSAYELYLAAMSVLYHDIGILRRQAGHAELSAFFVREEKSSFLLNARDRDIIEMAVASHSSDKDLVEATKGLAEEELIGDHVVRPRVVAALVRLADELDEDSRRADPTAAHRLELPEASRFYWEFCQRISGIQPKPNLHKINLQLQFRAEDPEAVFLVDGKHRAFVVAFSEKLAKMNGERAYCSRFLPSSLRYDSINVVVKAPPDHKKWKSPRRFTFTDSTSAGEFLGSFPELFHESTAARLSKALEHIRQKRYEEANRSLETLERVVEDVPRPIRLKLLYDRACLESLQAESDPPSSRSRAARIRRALEALREWLDCGLTGGWSEVGATARNEIFWMGTDADLQCLLTHARPGVKAILPADLQDALPDRPPERVGARGGGCVPRGTLVRTPQGLMRIEQIRVGDLVLATSPFTPGGVISTRVERVHSSRESRCVSLNGSVPVTAAQPLHDKSRGWVLARGVSTGMEILTATLGHVLVERVAHFCGHYEVFSLTVTDPSGTFLTADWVCHNKKTII